MDEQLTFRIAPHRAGARFDKYLSERFPFRSRTFWARSVDRGSARLAGRPVKGSTEVRGGDVVVLEPTLFTGLRQTLRLDQIPILWRDDAVLVVDKPAGLLVHPLNSLTHGALTDLLSRLMGRAAHVQHRLDRLTSGAMVAAFDPAAAANLEAQFRGGDVQKLYLALVDGVVAWDRREVDVEMGSDLESSIRLKMAVGGADPRPSRTRFTVKERFAAHSLVEAEPLTGRQHQIRVHLSFLGHPIVGDRLYGRVIDVDYFETGIANLSPFYPSWQGLHAARLEFVHPVTGAPVVAGSAPSGPMGECLERLRAGALTP